MGKRSFYCRQEPPSRGFAPALARKKSKSDEHHEDDRPSFKWAKGDYDNEQQTWTTLDPDTSKRTWTTPHAQSQATTSPIVWDQWAKDGNSHGEELGTVAEHELHVAPEVRCQFVDERFLMREPSQPRSIFERNNASLLGLHTPGRIVSQIGDEEVVLECKIDNRAEFRDHNNEYIDGINRGKMPKRFEDELATRRRERREEMQRANTLFLEWQSLDEDEKEIRRAKARKNRANVLKSLETELEEEVPAAYNIDVKILWKRVREYKLRQSEAASQPVSSVLSQRDAPGLPSSHDDNVSEALFVPLEHESTRSGSTQSLLDAHNAPNSRSRVQRQGRHDLNIPNGPRKRHPEIRDRPAYSQSSDSRNVSSRHRQSRLARSGHGQSSTLESSHGPRSPSVRSVSTFNFSTWPELTPMEDIAKIEEREYLNEIIEYNMMEALCEQKGRLVIVSLIPNVKYSSAAILDRLYGGAIQEIQFFPEERQAVLAFLSPLDAKAFLEHIAACQRESEHEYRRLQIHASYYKGAPEKAVHPVQEGVLTEAIVNDASRALRIDKVHKDISREVLLLEFKKRFGEQHLVRLKLVTPKKRYLQEVALSNSAVLEFASIKQAIDVKGMFDEHKVAQFEQSTASYLSDPSGITPTRMPWCACLNCKPEPVVELNEDGHEDEDYSYIRKRYVAPRSEVSHDTSAVTFIQMAREMRLAGDSYDVEGDLKAPDQFESRQNAPLQPKSRERVD